MVSEAILGLVGTVTIAALGWVFQLGNRLTVLETKEPSLERLIDTRFDDVDKRLDRIERALNGVLHSKE